MPVFLSYIHGLRLTSSAQIENKLPCGRPPICHTTTSNITHSATDSSLHVLPTCTASALHTLQQYQRWAASSIHYAVYCSWCAVVRRWPALCICTVHTERCQNVSAFALHISLYINCSGVHSTVCSACCCTPLECAVSALVQ